MGPTEHVCPQCRRKRLCAEIGHNWGEWRPIDMRGIPVNVRWCFRCSERDIAPVVPS